MENNIICFTAETLILTPNGKKEIQTIKPSDEIFSFNHSLGSIDVTTVKKTASSYHSQLVNISFDDESILEMTIDHPIWIVNKGWASFKKNRLYKVFTDMIDVGDYCLALNKNYEIINKRINNISFHRGLYKMHIIAGGELNNFFANDCLVHDENLIELDLIREGIDFDEMQSTTNTV